MFLTDIDFSSHQRAFDMDILTDSNNAVTRNFAENAATEQIKSFLRRRYDVDQVFIDVTTWDNAKTYNEDDHVIYNDVIYYALQASTGSQPDTSPNDWQQGDKRDPFLVMTTVDMTVYHLYAKIPKRSTPEDVDKRYLDAIEWLRGVSTGEFIPNYPVLVDDETTGVSSNQTKWGSQTKIDHRY